MFIDVWSLILVTDYHSHPCTTPPMMYPYMQRLGTIVVKGQLRRGTHIDGEALIATSSAKKEIDPKSRVSYQKKETPSHIITNFTNPKVSKRVVWYQKQGFKKGVVHFDF